MAVLATPACPGIPLPVRTRARVYVHSVASTSSGKDTAAVKPSGLPEQRLLRPGPNHKALNKHICEQQTAEGVLAVVEDSLADCNPVNLVTAFYRLGKLAAHAPPAAQQALRSHHATRRLLAALEAHGPSLDSRQVSSVLFAHAVLGHGSEQLLEQALAALRRPGLQASPQDKVLLVYSMARLGRPEPAFLRRFVEGLLAEKAQEQQQAGAQPRADEAAALLSSDRISTRQQEQQAGSREEQQQEQQQQQDQGQPQPQQARQQRQGQQRGHAQQQALLPGLASFSSKDLCLMAWSLGELGHAQPLLLRRIAGTVLSRGLASQSVQSMCNLLSTLAAAGVVHEELCDAVAAEVLRRPAHKLQEQDVCNLAHSLSVLWQRQLEVEGHSRDNRVAWSRLTQAHMRAVPARMRLFSMLASRALELAPRLSSRALPTLCWAYASLGLRQQRRLMDALAARGMLVAGQMDAHSISSTAWSFSSLSHDSPRLMEALAEAAARQLACPEHCRAWGAQSVSVTLFSFASLNRTHSAAAQRMLAALARRALELLPEFTRQGLSNLAWGLAVAGYYPEGLLRAWRKLAGSKAQEFTSVELTQLHLVEVALQLEAPHICSDDADAPTEYRSFFQGLLEGGRLRGLALRGWSANKMTGPANVSEYQQQVYGAVEALVGARCQLEWRQPGGDYSIDIALPAQRIAIEADGPVHYAYNTQHLLGATALKRRLLAKLGWAIVDVPFYEWTKLRGPEEQQGYMQRKLAAVGLVPEGLPLPEQQRQQEQQQPAAQEASTPDSSTSTSHEQLGTAQQVPARACSPSGSTSAESQATTASRSQGEGTGAEASPSSQQQQQQSAGQEVEQQDEAAAAAMAERARRLAMMNYSKGRISRQGLVAKEGSLRVGEQRRRQQPP